MRQTQNFTRIDTSQYESETAYTFVIKYPHIIFIIFRAKQNYFLDIITCTWLLSSLPFGKSFLDHFCSIHEFRGYTSQNLLRKSWQLKNNSIKTADIQAKYTPPSSVISCWFRESCPFLKHLVIDNYRYIHLSYIPLRKALLLNYPSYFPCSISRSAG